jgi:monoamine oxidase
MSIAETTLPPVWIPAAARARHQRRRTRALPRARAARATTAAASSSSADATSSEKPEKPKAVVVGGGWAGFGAAWQLLKHGFDVTLLDAAPNPVGLRVALTPGCQIGYTDHHTGRHQLNVFCDCKITMRKSANPTTRGASARGGAPPRAAPWRRGARGSGATTKTSTRCVASSTFIPSRRTPALRFTLR